MGYECFEVDVDGGVGHLTLRRPDDYNTMTPAFWRELPEIVSSLDDGGEVRALVLSSTGKHFSAGMDTAVFTGGAGVGGDLPEGSSTEVGRQRARLRQTVLRLQETFTCLEQARMPVLAAVQGGCVGGAVDMVSACDLRFASADAFFVVQEINLGMTADVGTLQRLPKIIPYGIAAELAYRGHRMPAARAREVGLVNDVFDDHDALVAGVLEIAAEIAAKSPLAIWGTKEMLRYSRDHTVADSLEHIATWQAGMFQPADMMESFTAKAERRDPGFDDLLPNPREGL